MKDDLIFMIAFLPLHLVGASWSASWQQTLRTGVNQGLNPKNLLPRYKVLAFMIGPGVWLGGLTIVVMQNL